MSAKELNIGDYVRTKGGNIFKIVGGNTDNWEVDISYIQLEQTEENWYESNRYNDNGYWFNEENIIKSSPNIIDLIELRDIVELFEEDDGDGELTGFYEVLAYTTDRKEIGVRNKDGEIDFYPAENLRGIITYEQIASMEYKIGEQR